jgi:two-component system catabolic regulation response regulator CreB
MPNILLVEDDKVIAESIIFALENDYDSFKTHCCTLGNNAIDYFNNNDVDLILLDIGLPDISGFDVLRKIRKTSDIPVIIVTARDDDADIILGLEGMGADDYVTKPLSPRVLVARVKAQLRHVNQQPSTTEKLPSEGKQMFKINKDLNQILLHDQAINLTKAECKILLHLVENPNRIHSKEQLLNAMHDRPTGSSENTIVTHIRLIRKALNEIDSDNEYIKNHRGLGYSLIL